MVYTGPMMTDGGGIPADLEKDAAAAAEAARLAAEEAARVAAEAAADAANCVSASPVFPGTKWEMTFPAVCTAIGIAGRALQIQTYSENVAVQQATEAAELRNEKEVGDLSLAYGKGATGRGMATGGSKAIKDLEKEQKTRQTRMIRDGLDAALLDIATFYRDVMMVQAGANDALINKELETEIRTLAEKTKPQSTIKKINAIMDARTNLSHNAAPLLTVEALMCVLAR